MSKESEKKLYWLYLAGFFLIAVLPLLSAPPLLHPASWAKSIFFKIIFSLIILVFVFHNFFISKNFWNKLKESLRSKASIPLILLLLLGLIYLLSSIFSLDPRFSFWGTPARGGGAITIILLIIFSVLAFLIIKKKHWQHLWDFSLFIGILVSSIGIIQKFELFPKLFTPQPYRTFSTMGGSAFLAMYALLLIFPALAFGFEKIRIKSIYYFISAILLIAVVFTTATRSAFIALIIGLLSFIFLYPKKNKKVLYLKIGVVILIILSVFGSFWLRGQPSAIEKITKIPLFGTAFERVWEIAGPILDSKEISFEKIVSPGRYSGWQVLWPALNDRPILGYGPENVSIPFDKYYDPSIEGISSEITGGGSGWWDRAHNIFLEVGITIGIPGLIIYLLLFAVVFYKLQKIKKESLNRVTATGIQAAFISYFVINSFNFDVFSTYMLSLLLIAYSLFLIKDTSQAKLETENESVNSALWKYIVFTVLIFITLWFVWFENINPLMVNKDINNADLFALDIASTNENCKRAIYLTESLVLNHSFIDNYVRLKYIDTISLCVTVHPETKLELSQKAISLLEEAKELRPYYTRTWFYSAVFANRIIESDPNLTEEQKQSLTNDSYESLKRAEELSPKRIEIFLTWIKTSLIIKDYETARAKADQCIKLNPESSDCYWAKALVLINSDPKNSDEALELIKITLSKDQSKDAYIALSQLILAYENWAKQTQDKEYYKILEELYIEKIKLNDTKFQDHAALAYAYSLLGKYDKAREEAAIVLKLSPESKDSVEAFLKTLPR